MLEFQQNTKHVRNIKNTKQTKQSIIAGPLLQPHPQIPQLQIAHSPYVPLAKMPGRHESDPNRPFPQPIILNPLLQAKQPNPPNKIPIYGDG